MRKKTACFTGHRNIAEKDLPRLMQRLEETIAGLIQQGVVYFANGGAYGWLRPPRGVRCPDCAEI